MSFATLLRSALVLAFVSICSPIFAAGEIGATVIVGGGGGADFQDKCNDGDYLVGFAAAGGKDLNQVRAVCQHFNAQGATDSDPYDLNTWGKRDGGPVATSSGSCDPNTAVEKITVETSKASLVHRFKFACRNPLAHDYTDTEWSATKGGAAQSTQMVRCGGGAIAIGLVGRQGDEIDGLGLLCVTLVSAPPPATTGKLVTLESTNFPGMFIRHQNFQGVLTKLSSDLDHKDATFKMVTPGLAGQGVSFESTNFPGLFLRHKNFILVLEKNDGSQQFASDASFKVVDKGNGGSQFESVNFPGLFLRHKNFKLVLEKNDGSDLFQKDSTFNIREADGSTPPPPNTDNPPADNGDNNPPPDNGNGGAGTAATDTTIYDQPEGNDVAYLNAGDPVTIVSCNDDNWCQISKPKKGWVWGDDLNH